MDREEAQMLGFEIVAYAGEATYKLMKALQLFLEENYDESRSIYNEAVECIVRAHNVQTSMLQKEAMGEEIPYSFTMGHGQDHLMSSVLLREVMDTLLKSKNV